MNTALQKTLDLLIVAASCVCLVLAMTAPVAALEAQVINLPRHADGDFSFDRMTVELTNASPVGISSVTAQAEDIRAGGVGTVNPPVTQTGSSQNVLFYYDVDLSALCPLSGPGGQWQVTFAGTLLNNLAEASVSRYMICP